jgi:hypothetical protein
MTLTGTITAANLRAEFDASRAGFDALFALSAGVTQHSFVSTGDGSYEFTPAGDCELIGLGLDTTHTSSLVTLTLTVEAADGNVLLRQNRVWSLAQTLSGGSGTERARAEFPSTDRLTLRGGVTYRMTLTNSGAAVTTVVAFAEFGIERRIR